MLVTLRGLRENISKHVVYILNCFSLLHWLFLIFKIIIR